ETLTLTFAKQLPTGLVGGMGQPLGDYRGVYLAGLLSRALADYVVPVFNLGGVNVIDFLIAVVLAHPLRRAVEHTGLLQRRTRLTHRQAGFCLTASYNSTFPARLLVLGGCLMSEHRHHQGAKYQREQQSESLLQHVFSSPYYRDHRQDVMCSPNTRPRGPKRASF